MKFDLLPLPYAKNALAPYVSAETLHFHHDEHQAAYLAKLRELIAGTPVEAISLEQIIVGSARAGAVAVFENAAQVWNHQFLWHSMKPGGGGHPTGPIAAAIDRDLGGYEAFRTQFTDACMNRFGSGWGWLIEQDGRLAVVSTANADLPMRHGDKALLTCDVWEHAYYLDYRNQRRAYVEAFLDHLVNWDFASFNLG